MKLNQNLKSLLDFRQKRLIGIQTGIKELDKQILGLTGIVGIQGAPGSCKSTLALQIASYNAEKGYPILFLDRENGVNRLRFRLMCQINNTYWTNLYLCPLKEFKQYVKDSLGIFGAIYVYNTISYGALKDTIQNLIQEYQKPVILILDSLQSFARTSSNFDEKVAIESWLEDLDQLKLDFEENLLIIATFEKTKDTFQNNSLSAGKGSASISYKSEVLFDMEQIDNQIHLSCLKVRDDCSGFKLILDKQLVISDNPRSFNFRLDSSHVEF